VFDAERKSDEREVSLNQLARKNRGNAIGIRKVSEIKAEKDTTRRYTGAALLAETIQKKRKERGAEMTASQG